MTDSQQDVEFCWKPNPALKDARDWIEKHKFVDDDGPLPKIDTHIFNNYGNNPKETVAKIVRKLEKDQDMASAILELCGFTREDSAKAVQTLIDDFRFYAQDHWPYFDDAAFVPSTVPVEFWNASIDIPIVGRILGPAMRLGTKLCFSRADEKSSIFWTYLANILADCGVPLLSLPFPGKVVYFPPVNFSCGGEFVEGKVGFNSPVIVFENSDIFAAVKSVIQSVWEFNGKTYWTPTHVYVQESQFETFVRLLKMDAVNHIKLLGIDEINREATKGHPPILQPCDSSHFKFFLGWDPKVLDVEEEVGGGVVVLPFRTVDEGTKAANSLPNTFCASLWTEKAKFGSQTASLLKDRMRRPGALYVQPFTPNKGLRVEWKKEQKHDCEVFEMLLAMTKPKIRREIEEISPSQGQAISLKEFVAKDEAEAMKKVKSPSLLKDVDKIPLLRPLQKHISALDPSFDWVWSPDFSYRVTESGMEVTSRNLPGTLQYLTALSNNPTAVATVLVMAHYFISRGTPLIVRLPAAVFLEWFEQHPPLQDLCQKGFIVFVVHVGDVESFDLVKDRRALVLFEGDVSGKQGIEEGIDFPVSNIGLLPHFSHVFTHTKNVFLV